MPVVKLAVNILMKYYEVYLLIPSKTFEFLSLLYSSVKLIQELSDKTSVSIH